MSISKRSLLFGKVRKTVKRGKVLANQVFPISSVGIFYIERAVTIIHSLHTIWRMLMQCCEGYMMAKERYVSHVGGCSSGGEGMYNFKMEQ
jgi:hypothetical protein